MGAPLAAAISAEAWMEQQLGQGGDDAEGWLCASPQQPTMLRRSSQCGLAGPLPLASPASRPATAGAGGPASGRRGRSAAAMVTARASPSRPAAASMLAGQRAAASTAAAAAQMPASLTPARTLRPASRPATPLPASGTSPAAAVGAKAPPGRTQTPTRRLQLSKAGPAARSSLTSSGRSSLAHAAAHAAPAQQAQQAHHTSSQSKVAQWLHSGAGMGPCQALRLWLPFCEAPASDDLAPCGLLPLPPLNQASKPRAPHLCRSLDSHAGRLGSKLAASAQPDSPTGSSSPGWRIPAGAGGRPAAGAAAAPSLSTRLSYHGASRIPRPVPAPRHAAHAERASAAFAVLGRAEASQSASTQLDRRALAAGGSPAAADIRQQVWCPAAPIAAGELISPPSEALLSNLWDLHCACLGACTCARTGCVWGAINPR
jgi:hypothetical protein